MQIMLLFKSYLINRIYIYTFVRIWVACLVLLLHCKMASRWSFRGSSWIFCLFFFIYHFRTLMYQVSLPENKNKQTREKNPMFFGDKGRSIIYKDIHQNVCIPSSITFDALHYFFRTSFLWNRHVIYVNFLNCFYGWGRFWKSTSTWSGFKTSYKDLSIICSWSWSMQWNSIGANEECTKMFLKVHITLWNSDFIKNSCSELFWMFESITTFSRNGKKPENQNQILLKPKFRI